ASSGANLVLSNRIFLLVLSQSRSGAPRPTRVHVALSCQDWAFQGSDLGAILNFTSAASRFNMKVSPGSRQIVRCPSERYVLSGASGEGSVLFPVCCACGALCSYYGSGRSRGPLF
ncbi:hypothetical protein HOY82DRAFT_573934, partial [Tuber indicum]